MMRHWKYLKYVLRHKWFVFIECLKLGVPIWIAIAHDWDKFLPGMWMSYARTFYAPDGTSQYENSVYFAEAWMRHQHRNKHHWQHWLWVKMPLIDRDIRLRQSEYMVWDSGKVQRVVTQMTVGGVVLELLPPDKWHEVGFPDPMPDVYIREMVADWRGAGRAAGKTDTAAWYEKNRDKIILHPDTRQRVEELLGISATERPA